VRAKMEALREVEAYIVTKLARYRKVAPRKR
jgi:hypothetical protein